MHFFHLFVLVDKAGLLRGLFAPARPTPRCLVQADSWLGNEFLFHGLRPHLLFYFKLFFLVSSPCACGLEESAMMPSSSTALERAFQRFWQKTGMYEMQQPEPNSTKPTLLGLPTELRLHIFEHLFENTTIHLSEHYLQQRYVNKAPTEEPDALVALSRSTSRLMINPGTEEVLLTCKQLYAEAKPVYIRSATMTVSTELVAKYQCYDLLALALTKMKGMELRSWDHPLIRTFFLDPMPNTIEIQLRSLVEHCPASVEVIESCLERGGTWNRANDDARHIEGLVPVDVTEVLAQTLDLMRWSPLVRVWRHHRIYPCSPDTDCPFGLYLVSLLFLSTRTLLT